MVSFHPLDDPGVPLQATESHESIPFWRDERVLRYATQVVSAVLVLGFLYWAVTNFLNSASQRGMGLGYGFLDEAAGFPISESIIPYTTSHSFGYAFMVGIVNTIRVAGIGIALATVLGTFIGLARLSSNWLVSRLAIGYIEAHRNIPLLVLLVLWFRGVLVSRLPQVENAIRWPGPIYLSQRGIVLTWPQLTDAAAPFLISIGVGFGLALVSYFYLQNVQVRTGRATYFLPASLLILLLTPALGWLVSPGTPLRLDVPALGQFNFQGGLLLTPEFSALLIGLTLYTSAFIAEVVRGGIQSVARGQMEAALSVGLTHAQSLRLVVIPQALRVILPPLISQYLNLTKNSSLAFFIGYPDLFAVAKITANQAGRAVSVFGLAMAAYLSMSLITSFAMNIYNRRVQFLER